MSVSAFNSRPAVHLKETLNAITLTKIMTFSDVIDWYGNDILQKLEHAYVKT